MRALRTKRNLPEGVVIPKDPPTRLDQLTMHDLSPKQRDALVIADTQGALPGHNGVAAITLKALERKQLIHLRTSKKGRTSWRATDTGRYLVHADNPLYLHKHSYSGFAADGSDKGSGYTHDPKYAWRGEPEVINREAA